MDVSQVITKKRVADHGEVLTGKREVNAMLDLVSYEDSSLSYAGINKHEGEDIGLYDTVITRKDTKKVFENVPAGGGYGV